MSKRSAGNHVCSDQQWASELWPAFLDYFQEYENGTRWRIEYPDEDAGSWVEVCDE